MISNEIIAEPKILSVFDFDGTLTRYDTFISFLYFAFSKRYFAKCLLRMTLPTLYYICHIIMHDKLKAVLIKTFLTGIDEYWLYEQAELFCERYWKKLMRPTAVLAVMTEINSGAEVTICSAAPALLLQPFAHKLGINLIGTQLEIKNGKLTGRIIGQNCRCSQKVARLTRVYGDLSLYHLRVWGDTSGDYELLAIAQNPHWKHFHKTNA